MPMIKVAMRKQQQQKNPRIRPHRCLAQYQWHRYRLCEKINRQSGKPKRPLLEEAVGGNRIRQHMRNRCCPRQRHRHPQVTIWHQNKPDNGYLVQELLEDNPIQHPQFQLPRRLRMVPTNATTTRTKTTKKARATRTNTTTTRIATTTTIIVTSKAEKAERPNHCRIHGDHGG